MEGRREGEVLVGIRPPKTGNKRGDRCCCCASDCCPSNRRRATAGSDGDDGTCFSDVLVAVFPGGESG